LETVSSARSFAGTQGVYTHRSTRCGCDMTFAVFMPPQAQEKPVPVLWYLSGLTCTHANVMDKGEYRAHAALHGVAIVCPDTSPRGEEVPDDKDNWQFGSGAGFYLDASCEPWRKHYQMYSYIRHELQELVLDKFKVDGNRQGIFGHSMGGHGALTLALKNPDLYKSCSAFAPIVQPTTADWSSSSFQRYLGDNPQSWDNNDATKLIENGARFPELLVDQGEADGFLNDGLRPWLLEAACKKANIPLTLRMQEGYDHSYFFISTFMQDHITWHAERL
jgi:S-formylglutathione hydrolase